MAEPRHGDRELTILKGVVENTNEALVTIDREHRVLLFNKAAERVFGYGREEVIGRDLDLIMAPSCSRDHRRAVARYVATGVLRTIGHDTEITATRKNGEGFPASISFSVSEVEQELYFTAIIRDLTEKKALQEQIAESERLAALGRVVAEIIHEIKNPLILIGGFAGQLLKEATEEGGLHKLHIIVDEIARLEDLLRELRDLYTPRKPEFAPADMAHIAQAIVALVEGDCRARGITLRFETGGKPIPVLGDEARLKQVFLNLVRNAMEATEKGGTVTVGCRSSGRFGEVSVADDGKGIPAADQDRIFAPFFTTKTRGTGLGLSVSKRIVEEHAGGSLYFHSQPGKGTTFTVKMPMYGSEKEKTAPWKDRRRI